MIGRVAIVCLMALALPLVQRFAEAVPPSDAAEEKKTQREKCQDPIKETPANNPYSSNYPCPLMNQLRYYANCDCVPNGSGGNGLSPTDKTALLDWITTTESELAGWGEVNDTCVVQISLSLKIFLEAHVSISNSICQQTLNDSTGAFYGTVRDYIDVAVQIQFEVIGPVVKIDNDRCPLIDAIEEAAEASGDEKIIAECANLTRSIRKVLKVSGYNLTEQLSFVFQLIMKECSAETIVYLKTSCSISGFGSFRSVFDVCQINARVLGMNAYLSGSESECKLLKDLKAAKDRMCNVASPNIAQCGQLTSLIQQITVIIQMDVTIEVKLQLCADWIFEYCKGSPWLYNIELDEGECNLFDFVQCSAFCRNNGGCQCNEPPPELPCQESGECSGSGSGSGSGETVTPPECDGTGPCASGSVSGETATPPSCDGTGPCASSEETVTPPSCDGTGPCASSEETVTPPSCDGTGPCASSEETATPEASGETVSVPVCDGTGPCASDEVTTPSGSESAETTPEASTAGPTPGSTPGSTPVPTTPSPCSLRGDLITIDPVCNCTAFLVSIMEVTTSASWTASEKLSIKPTITQLINIIYGPGTIEQKIALIMTQISSVNVSVRVKFRAIVIYRLGADKKRDMNSPWGNVGQYGDNCQASS